MVTRGASRGLLAAAAILGEAAERDRPIGTLTTYRVGGRAALYAEVGDEASLALVARAVSETGVAVLVVGRGSNLLVSDAGYEGLAVRLKDAFAAVSTSARGITAGGAAAYPVLARRSAAAGLTGLEWAVGIPGSVGGGVAMNAGGHGSETRDHLESAVVVDLAAGGGRQRLLPADLDLSYRHSSVAATDLVVEATFALEPGDPDESSARIAEIVRWRRANQPGGQNAGSVFTNPPGDSAGRLIEAAGLKGLRVGSAAVSGRHANFVQADPGGSAEDVLRVVRAVQQAVADRLGVELSTEVRLVGW